MNRKPLKALIVLLILGVMMAANVTLTGSGQIGRLGPKWSVTQQCTPAAPGDTSGSVGSASMDAFARSTSVFAIDNDLILTDPTAGEFRGNVVASPVVGRKVHLDVAGKLNFLVADRTVDPVWFDAGTPLLFGTMGTGTGQFTQPYSVAVDPFDDSIFVMSSGTGGVGRYVVVKFSSTGTYITEFGSFGSGNGQFGGFAFLAVSPTDGTVAVGDGANSRVQFFTPNGPRTTYTYSTKVGTLGAGTSQFGSTQPIPVAYDSTGALHTADRGNGRLQKFTISGATVTYVTQVAITGFYATVPIYGLSVSPTDVVWVSLVTSLDAGAVGTFRRYNTTYTASSGDIQVTAPPGTTGGIFNIAADSTGIWANWGFGNYLAHYTVAISPAVATEDARWYSGYPAASDLNTNYAMAVKTTGEIVVLFKSTTFQTQPGLYGDYRVTSFDWTPVPLSDAIEGYMRECDSTLGGFTYSYDASSDPDVVFPAWSGDVWSRLKEICTAYQLEIYLDGTVIHVDDIGSRTITLANHSPLKVTPTNLFGGQQIVIVAQNPTAGAGVVFDASTQNQRFQIDVGQTQTVSVTTLHSPVSVDALVPADTLPVLPGQYYVLDSTGTHVPAASWSGAGAAVTPALGDSTGQVRFTLQGPLAAISGYTGPFTFADSISSTGRAALTLTGTGTFTAPKAYTFATGANPTKTTQLVARTISSFAIATIEQIARIAPAAIDDVSGYAVEVSFDIFTSDLLGFGLTQGSTFTAQDSRYRVKDIQWGALKSQITGTRHVTLDELDTITAGLTVDQRDAIWSGYSIDDRGIKPYALAL